MMLSWKKAIILLLGTIILFGTATVSYSAMYPVSDRWMVAHSDVIVTGKIISITSNYESDGLIWSYATIRVADRVMGITPDEVIFKYQGGTVGEVTMGVSISPKFEIGEEVLVFLKNADDGMLEITNWNLSKYTLVNGSFLENGKTYREYIDELTEIIKAR